MDVGIRELKQHLSHYLDRAAAGETLRVTDRGQAKALLSPVLEQGRLQAGIDEGWIRAPKTDACLGHVEPFRSTLRTLDVLSDDRGE